MLKRNFSRMSAVRVACLLGVLALFALLSSAALAQTTVATGSIVGTVTDATDAVVSGAKVTFAGPTGQTITVSTDAAGNYSSGFVVPGVYNVRVAAKGSKTAQLLLAVRVDTATMGNVKLQAGQETALVEMHTSGVQVNTHQATVQTVLTASEIEDFPLNGRNFLDLAQLVPGVQTEDGQSVDPTKAGYISVSIGGRLGRSTRTEVDGADVSDERVGTSTTGIPAGSIQEFQVAQASFDMSTELTTSGSVNVATKSGTNAIHSEAFGQFRDNSIASAALPGGGNPPFQRSQYGADVGEAVIKDKLFFFANGERTKQDNRAPVPISGPFQAYSGGFSNPFRENNATGRLDYEFSKSARLFYRFSYFNNRNQSWHRAGY